MRINALRYQNPVEVTFDDLVVTPSGGIDFHPDLTTHISGEQWADLYEAMAFALRQGIVMNVHVTIVWDRLGVHGDNTARELLEKFCGALRHRAAERKLPCGFIYAHERSRDEGFHTHLLTRWPHIESDAFRLWAGTYFMDRSKLPVPDLTAVEVVPRQDNDVWRHWLWFGYLTKGAAPGMVLGRRAGRRRTGVLLFRLDDFMLRRPEPCGLVWCRKRVGVSRNFDHKARRDWPLEPGGFWSRFKFTQPDRKEDLYTDEYWQAHELDKRRAAMDNALRTLQF